MMIVLLAPGVHRFFSLVIGCVVKARAEGYVVPVVGLLRWYDRPVGEEVDSAVEQRRSRQPLVAPRSTPSPTDRRHGAQLAAAQKEEDRHDDFHRLRRLPQQEPRQRTGRDSPLTCCQTPRSHCRREHLAERAQPRFHLAVRCFPRSPVLSSTKRATDYV